MTATDINHGLGKLYTSVAQDRLPDRTAVTLAFIGQLLLNSVPSINSEYKFYYRFDQWKDMLADAALSTPRALDAPTDPLDAATEPESGTEAAFPRRISPRRLKPNDATENDLDDWDGLFPLSAISPATSPGRLTAGMWLDPPRSDLLERPLR